MRCLHGAGALIRASRTNRLANRARALHKLANDIEAHDPTGANDLRNLASQLVQRVVELEKQRLRRRFDWAAPFAYLVMVSPAAVASYFAWRYGGWWTWPVFIIAGVWAVLITVVGVKNAWEEHEAGAQG